jgi:hypothetical protein
MRVKVLVLPCTAASNPGVPPQNGEATYQQWARDGLEMQCLRRPLPASNDNTGRSYDQFTEQPHPTLLPPVQTQGQPEGCGYLINFVRPFPVPQPYHTTLRPFTCSPL